MVYLVSWNVAGWTTTLKFVEQHHTSLLNWLQQHKIDVLCLQEVKLTEQRLKAEARACAAHVEGYDTFWACAKKPVGFNGVATFAKANTTIRAECRPLGQTELDDEGRCLMTEHHSFILFNVYAPNDSGGSRLPFKLQFLRALRQRMEAERKRCPSKAIMLVGDLNMALRPLDCSTAMLVDLTRMLEPGDADDPLGCKKVLQDSWPEITRLLTTREVRPQTVTSAAGKVEKWRLVVTDSEGKVVKLGNPQEQKEWAEASFRFDHDREVSEGEETFVLQERMTFAIASLTELMAIAGKSWTPTQLAAVRGNAQWARSSSPPPTLSWAKTLLEAGMVDCFAELRPGAKERYTCWNQYHNQRYFNRGARIDYTLVDRPFFERYVIKGGPLYGVGTTHADSMAALTTPPEEGLEEAPDETFMAARRAAVAHGGFTSAPFDGGGIQDAHGQAMQCQFYEPHTGFIYTPPQFSDHIAVTLLLGDDCLQSVKLEGDKLTKAAQPHREQPSIKSFFAAKQSASEEPPKLTKRKSSVTPFQPKPTSPTKSSTTYSAAITPASESTSTTWTASTTSTSAASTASAATPSSDPTPSVTTTSATSSASEVLAVEVEVTGEVSELKELQPEGSAERAASSTVTADSTAPSSAVLASPVVPSDTSPSAASHSSAVSLSVPTASVDASASPIAPATELSISPPRASSPVPPKPDPVSHAPSGPASELPSTNGPAKRKPATAPAEQKKAKMSKKELKQQAALAKQPSLRAMWGKPASA